MPSSEDQDYELKFSTYWNYLDQITNFMDQEYGNWQDFGDQALYKTRTLQGAGTFDTSWVRRFLRLGWNTEFLLGAGLEGNDDLLQLATHWVPIQGYYSVYCIAEATSYALTGSKPNSHARALKIMSNQFSNGGMRPWSLCYSGPIGKSRSDHEPVNFPDDIDPAHNLRRHGVEPIQIIAKCLYAEHKNRVEDKWQKGGVDCHKYELDPGKTSLLHFLYRLRIKANYKDVDIFVQKVSQRRLTEFNKSIRKFIFRTLLYFEIMLIRKFQKAPIIDLASEYIDTNSKAERLKERMTFYEEHV